MWNRVVVVWVKKGLYLRNKEITGLVNLIRFAGWEDERSSFWLRFPTYLSGWVNNVIINWFHKCYYIQYAYRVGHKLLRHNALKFFNISKEIIIICKFWKIKPNFFSVYTLSNLLFLKISDSYFTYCSTVIYWALSSIFWKTILH